MAKVDLIIMTAAKVYTNRHPKNSHRKKPIRDTLTHPSYSLVSLLGGETILKTTPKSNADWIALVRQGIPIETIDSITKTLDLTQKELCQIVNIPNRNLSRRKATGFLTPEESEKLHRLVSLVERSIEVFETLPAALDFLRTPNPSLNDNKPFELLDTELGAHTVLELLGRIEHGLFS